MSGDKRIGNDPLGQTADSYVANVLGVPAVQKRNRKKRNSGKEENPTNAPRRTYYVPNPVHERLVEAAEELDVGISNLHNYLLQRALEAWEREEWKIVPKEKLVRKILGAGD
jgi:post-segregation antitoxin (ccd killing protein)